MYWLFDVALIALFIAVFVDGLRKGVSGILFGVFSFFLRFLYTVVVVAAVVLVFELTGMVTALAMPIQRGLGESSIFPAVSGGMMTSEVLANAISALIFAIVGIAVAVITMFFISRAVRRARIVKGAGPSKSVIGIINRVIGVIITVAVFMAFVFIVFAFIHSIADAGGFHATDEMLRACPVSSLIYKNNPLTKLLNDTGLPSMIYNVFHGNLDQMM
ncbi:MAG: hypothetical protein ILP02_03065 [Clostridia bacterium]|nr:hypothetical protein [Clostridia bacterium]